MLKHEDNLMLTQVGSGTPMGNLLRYFWMPALLEEEVKEPDCAPVRLRLLGEDLVAFRDSDGRVGILDAYCPHRRVHLYFGRNEECGLRCVYHGWKFDVTGQCTDMPSEPPGSDFARKVRIASYPTRVRGGVVWIYMGPRERMPEPPDFEWSRLPVPQRSVIKRVQECNWAQVVEGGIDSSHLSFLHSRLDGNRLSSTGRKFPSYALNDSHPVIEVKETAYGLLVGARRDAESDSYYWRISQYLLPAYSMVAATIEGSDSLNEPYIGHAWVPIDDENTWVWTFSAFPKRPMTGEERTRLAGATGIWGPIDENFRPLLDRRNDYGLDREAQKTRTFTGIDGTANQDAAVQESMGRIVDRSRERLGSSDMAIIAWRRMMLSLAKDLADGIPPALAGDPALYNRRSASVILKRDADWAKEAEYLFRVPPAVAERASG